MNTQSILAKKVEELTKPGDYKFNDELDYIFIILPGTKHPDALQVNNGPPLGPRVWGWNGDVDNPTLEPSIGAPEWHGYLRSGKLQSC